MEEPRLNDRLESLDQAVTDWAKLTSDQLKRRLIELGIHARVRVARAAQGRRSDPKLLSSVKFNVKRSYGVVDYIGFRFARQGVFIEHGVGRGRPRGSAQAEAAKKQWLSIVIPPRMEVLAEMLANEYADIAAAELRILVPGLIDTKISR